jgi:hypothetical protein
MSILLTNKKYKSKSYEDISLKLHKLKQAEEEYLAHLDHVCTKISQDFSEAKSDYESNQIHSYDYIEVLKHLKQFFNGNPVLVQKSMHKDEMLVEIAKFNVVV